MRTPELSDSDFVSLTQLERAAQEGSSTFTLETEAYGNVMLGFHRVAGQFQGVSLVAEKPPQNNVTPSVYFDGQNTYGFPLENGAALSSTLQANRAITRPQPPFPERVFENAQPQTVSAIGAATLLHNVIQDDARRLMFFTGAGISLGGNVPIYDHSHFLGQLGISESGTKEQANDAFCEAFFSQDGKAEEVYKLFLESNERFFADASTVAHCAIAGIVRAADCAPLIFTTNHDLKHESQGSRLGAIKVPPYWHDDICRRPDLAVHVRNAIQSHRGAIDLAVVVGVSRDYRRILEGLRGDNENFRVISINSSAEPQPYVSSSDYYLHGDAQIALPQITEVLVPDLEK